MNPWEENLKRGFDSISVPDKPLRQAVPKRVRFQTTRQIGRKLAYGGFVAAVLIGSLFAFSPDFRGLFISEPPLIAPAPGADAPPSESPSPLISDITRQYAPIESVLRIYTVEPPEGYTSQTPGYVTNDEGETFLRFEHGAYVPVETIRVQDTIERKGTMFTVDFSYALRDGKPEIAWRYDEEIENSEAQINSFANNSAVWLLLKTEGHMIPVVYDIETCEVWDSLADSGALSDSTADYIEFYVFSNINSCMLVCNQPFPDSPKKYYLLDADTKTATFLKSFVIDFTRANFDLIDVETLTVSSYDKDRMLVTYSIYSIPDDTMTVLYKDIPYVDEVAAMGQPHWFILYEIDKYVLVDWKTGMRYPVDGLAPEEALEIYFYAIEDGARFVLAQNPKLNDSGKLTQTLLGFLSTDTMEITYFSNPAEIPYAPRTDVICCLDYAYLIGTSTWIEPAVGYFGYTIVTHEIPEDSDKPDPQVYGLAEKTIYADIHGDGTQSVIELDWEWSPTDELEGDSEWYPSILSVDGREVNVLIEAYAWVKPTYIGAADLNGDGKDELVFLNNTGGQGGYGSNLVSVFQWNGETFVPLPMPGMERNRIYEPDSIGGYGFSCDVILLDGYRVDIVCDETEFSGILDAEKDIVHPGGYGPPYDDDGIVVEEYSSGLDAICDSRLTASGTLEIWQYAWANSHVGGIGFLVSELTWDTDGRYQVISQQFVPLEAYDEMTFR